MKKFIPVAEPDLSGKEFQYVKDCFDTNWISSSGKYIKKFEEDFSSYCDVKYGVAVSNGTVALHLALLSLEIGPGDEVIVPNFTFAASVNSIIHTGATPVFIDSDRESWNMDISKIEEKITPKTKAIMVVHIYGNPCDMDQVIDLKEKYDLYIIEDCAEAHGALYKGLKVGDFGDISCFSFFANKVMTTGEGGICLTSNLDLYDKMLVLRDHGMSKEKKYWHDVVGYNYRMTNIQAAIGCAQLERLDDFIEKKLTIANTYKKYLDKSIFEFQCTHSENKNINWLTSVLLPKEVNRDFVINKLKQNNIDSRPFFYPMNEMPPFKTEGVFLVSKSISRRGINLPSSVNLDKDTIVEISNILNKVVKIKG